VIAPDGAAVVMSAEWTSPIFARVSAQVRGPVSWTAFGVGVSRGGGQGFDQGVMMVISVVVLSIAPAVE